MLTVGPSQQCAPFARHSWPIKLPACRIKDLSHVAPRAVPQGMHAAGMPAKNLVPRMPLGPSVTLMEGMLCSGMGCVCQKSVPGSLWLIEDTQCRILNTDAAYRTRARFCHFVSVWPVRHQR